MSHRKNSVRGLSLGLMFVLLAGTAQAELAPPVTLAKCSLADRQPSADGVFRIPDTVRTFPATFNVACLAMTQAVFEGRAKVVAYQGESMSEAKTIGTPSPWSCIHPQPALLW